MTEEDVKRLKAIIEKENDSSKNAILYINYIPKDKILGLILKRVENGQEIVLVSQNCNLYIEKRKIKFDTSIRTIRM